MNKVRIEIESMAGSGVGSADMINYFLGIRSLWLERQQYAHFYLLSCLVLKVQKLVIICNFLFHWKKDYIPGSCALHPNVSTAGDSRRERRATDSRAALENLC